MKPPRTGRYTYKVSRRVQNGPLLPRVDPDSDVEVKLIGIAGDGNGTLLREERGRMGGVPWLRRDTLHWTNSGVHLLESEIELAGKRRAAESFNPPVLLISFPLEQESVEKLVTQHNDWAVWPVQLKDPSSVMMGVTVEKTWWISQELSVPVKVVETARKGPWSSEFELELDHWDFTG